jgi:hypothetical protein
VGITIVVLQNQQKKHKIAKFCLGSVIFCIEENSTMDTYEVIMNIYSVGFIFFKYQIKKNNLKKFQDLLTEMKKETLGFFVKTDISFGHP